MSNAAGPFALRNNFNLLLSPLPGQMRPVDGLRAISILLVLAIHCVWILAVFDEGAARFFYQAPFWLNWVFNGELGVDVFFVISGFLISSILMSEYQSSSSIRFGHFYKRRFMRLMPAYLLAMGFGLLLLPNKEYIWSNLLYINNLLPASTHFMPWTWSLAIEEQFYFLFPLLLLWILRRRSVRFLAVVMTVAVVASLLIRYLVIKHHQLRNCFRRNGQLIAWLSFLSLLVVVLVLSIPVNNQLVSFPSSLGTFYYMSFRHLFTMAIGFLLISSLYCEYGFCGWLARGLSARWLYPIGQLAYSTYLFHPFVIGALYGALFQLAAELSTLQKIAIATVAGIPLSLLIATAVYLFVERPFMNMRGGRRREVPAMPVSG